MKEKKTTIGKYLSEEKNKQLTQLLTNYFLKDVPINLFFKVFDKVTQNPSDVAAFILDSNNAYELAMFGFRASEQSKYNTYNGKSDYQGVKCTLGASHSKFHG